MESSCHCKRNQLTPQTEGGSGKTPLSKEEPIPPETTAPPPKKEIEPKTEAGGGKLPSEETTKPKTEGGSGAEPKIEGGSGKTPLKAPEPIPKKKGEARIDSNERLVEDGVRYPIEFLAERWEEGEKEPLERFLRAFKKIQELPPSDKRSFAYIAGLHGQPFITRPEVDEKPPKQRYEYWGGYCPHGTCLFPVWHRAYICYLEKALQHFEPDCMMCFWDELSDASLMNGVPSILTQDTVEIDGKQVTNPLKSFTVKVDEFDSRPPNEDGTGVDENAMAKKSKDAKEKMFTTVRYPLYHENFGSREERNCAEVVNQLYQEEKGVLSPNVTLNTNVIQWLSNYNIEDVGIHPEETTYFSTSDKYRMSLDAPNYTLFSCTSAMTFHNTTTGDHGFSLEEPHNDMHEAVGTKSSPYKKPTVKGGGDMGGLERSAFDPIFWFHHCFVDRMFWLWQVKHGATRKLEVEEGYKGTFSQDGENGPLVGQCPIQPLDMMTPLIPFEDCDCCDRPKYLTGHDVTNIDRLGYTYDKGQGVIPLKFRRKQAKPDSKVKDDGSKGTAVVKGVDRTRFDGSFVVLTYIVVGDKKIPAGYETVLNRLVPESCPGCMLYREKAFTFPLNRVDPEILYDPDAKIEVEFFGDIEGDKEINYRTFYKPYPGVC